MSKPIGVCRICGTYRPLSFEHVPPRAAFNNRRVMHYGFDDMFDKARELEAGFEG